MSGDPIRDYFSLLPASATAYYRYTGSGSGAPPQPPPQQPLHARYSGPVTALPYAGNSNAHPSQPSHARYAASVTYGDSPNDPSQPHVRPQVAYVEHEPIALNHFLKPSALALNKLSAPLPSERVEPRPGLSTASIANSSEFTWALRSNDPISHSLYKRLREAKFKSPDGICVIQDCEKRVRTKGLCKLHGGGKRCTFETCTRASQKGGLCISHGGGARCSEPECVKAAQSNGRCKAHGGGLRCQAEGCDKSSQGSKFCRQHGGGQRCSHEGCEKGTQRDGFCATHGGIRSCRVEHCPKKDRGGGYCAKHGGGKRCEVPNCNRSSRAKGKCMQHHQRMVATAAKASQQSNGDGTPVPGQESKPLEL